MHFVHFILSNGHVLFSVLFGRFSFTFQHFAFEQIDYVADETQLRHLRLNSLSVRQNVTYHCKNSHAFKTLMVQ